MKAKMFLAALSLGAQFVHSQTVQVSLPDLFGDHAIVQRDAATAVWGRAAPGETVTVTLGGARAEATTASDGWWTARLDTSKLGDGPLGRATWSSR